MTTSRHCTATTKTGKPCKATPLRDQDVCLAHADAETRESAGFVAKNGKGGRKPLPKVTDVLREKVEAEADRILAALFDALDADRGLVVGNGPSATVEHVTDHAVRIAAARELLDRVYGKPRQAVEHTGADGAPIVIAQPADGTDRSVNAAEIVERARRNVQAEVVAMNGNGNGHH
jgi:hypothetical protein